jgi:hypothetical protein
LDSAHRDKSTGAIGESQGCAVAELYRNEECMTRNGLTWCKLEPVQVGGHRGGRNALGRFTRKRPFCRSEGDNGSAVDGDTLTEFSVCELDRNSKERLLASTVRNSARPFAAGTDANPTNSVYRITPISVSEIHPSAVLPGGHRSYRELRKSGYL